MSSGGDDTIRVCSSCASPVQPSDQFCRSCGSAIGADTGATTPWPAGGAIGDTDPDLDIRLGPSGGPAGPPPGPSGPPPGPSGPPPGPRGPAPAAPATSPAGANPTAGPGPWWQRPVVWIAAGAAALVLLIVLAAVLLASGGGSGTAEAPALVQGEPTTVALEGNTGATRVHRARFDRGTTATVFVTGDQRFAPTVEIETADGEPVASESIAMGNKGTATTFTTTASGPHTIAISNFADDQPSYDVELRNVRFVTPQQLAVGDCVSRFHDEAWTRVSGFMIRSCDRAHDGQVFEQVPGFGDRESEAQNQCDIARNQRIRLPGYVHWRSFWGDDLTCIVVRGNGSGTLDESLVTR